MLPSLLKPPRLPMPSRLKLLRHRLLKPNRLKPLRPLLRLPMLPSPLKPLRLLTLQKNKLTGLMQKPASRRLFYYPSRRQ